jgi:hypothetical protein
MAKKSLSQTLRHLDALEARISPPVVEDNGEALRLLIRRYDEIAYRQREAGIPETTGAAAAKAAADFIAMMIERHGASPRGRG